MCEGWRIWAWGVHACARDRRMCTWESVQGPGALVHVEMCLCKGWVHAYRGQCLCKGWVHLPGGTCLCKGSVRSYVGECLCEA